MCAFGNGRLKLQDGDIQSGLVPTSKSANAAGIEVLWCGACGNSSYACMLCSQMYVMYAGGGQKVQVKNLDLLRHATLGRPKGTPLVTVSNHASCLDDPAVWGKPVSA